MAKASVTLGNVPLAANSPIIWQFQTGTTPYQTVMQVHREAWHRELKGRQGRAMDLVVLDSRGNSVVIRDVYILHEVASDSPNRVSFMVADKRWRWGYRLVARDYNVTRKSGDVTIHGEVPQTAVSVDDYDYLPYSLNGDDRWTAKDAVLDVLKILDPGLNPTWNVTTIGEDFKLQNVMLRDSGSAALQRLLSFIPSAQIYIDPSGNVVVLDGADAAAASAKYRDLPATSWTGEYPRAINMQAVRPRNVIPHYHREVEMMVEYDDDYNEGTTGQLNRDLPYAENVIRTVDLETTVTYYDPVLDATVTRTVTPGTWVPFKAWLAAMDLVKPAGSRPWTFDTIRELWVRGDLEGALGARGKDLDQRGDSSETSSVAMRVEALRQHFRQSFQLNRRYTERSRSIRGERVALLDPVTGARAPAAVWAQGCIIPTDKGYYISARKDATQAFFARNFDHLTGVSMTALVEDFESPATIQFIDAELGIFRIDWRLSPFGTESAIIPGNLVNDGGQPKVPTRDLSRQDDLPVGAGIKIESGATGIYLSKRFKFRAIVTVVPSAPNTPRQFHRERIPLHGIGDVFTMPSFGSNSSTGSGPDLDVFIPPSELTARYAWQDSAAQSTIRRLILEDSDEPVDMSGGYRAANYTRELFPHAQSVAAEVFAAYADGVQGNAVTRMPDDWTEPLVGSMTSAAIRVASYPSAKVDTVHGFTSRLRPVSRLAAMPEPVRHLVLGIVPFERA